MDELNCRLLVFIVIIIVDLDHTGNILIGWRYCAVLKTQSLHNIRELWQNEVGLLISHI